MKKLRQSRGIYSLALVFMVFMMQITFSDVDERGSSGRYFLSRQSVYAAEAWKGEFEDICSKTTNAMSLTKEELQTLVARCDKLKPRFETLDETQKRVYLRRLKMCRDLYQYVLESKEQETPAANAVK